MPRHPFDALSLVFSLIFGAVAVLAFVGPDDQLIDPRWIGPGLLVTLGLLLLVPSWRGRRDNRPPAPPGTSAPGEPVDEHPDD